jgi:argonaute-like protein implicated in RNA metabolism and viral defense
MATKSYERELGGINEKLDQLFKELGKQDVRFAAATVEANKDRASMKEDIQDIKAVMNKVEGGWKVLVVVGSIGGLLGGVFVKLVNWLVMK